MKINEYYYMNTLIDVENTSEEIFFSSKSSRKFFSLQEILTAIKALKKFCRVCNSARQKEKKV